MTVRYNRLQPGAAYLSGVRLALSRGAGATQADLDRAELSAAFLIQRRLAPFYRTSRWRHEPPGLVRLAADMLSSAKILRLASRGRAGERAASRLAQTLETDALALIINMRRGSIALFDVSGRPEPRFDRKPPRATRRMEAVSR